jgi:hypothetical protein
MAMLRTQPRGRAKVDWSNPITQGMAFALVHGLNAAGFCVSGQNFIPYVSASAVPMPSGLGARTTSASARGYVLGATGMTSTNYSLFAFGSATSSSVTQSAIDDDSSTVRKFQFRLANGKVEFIPFNTSAAVTGQPTFATALTASELARGFTMGATASPTRTAAFQNGQIATGTPSGLASPTGQFSIGARQTATQGWATGGLQLVVGWTRTLRDDEMQSLAENPWQLFLDTEDEDVFVGSAAPATSTGVLNATLGDVGLTAAGSVTVNGAASMALSGLMAAGSGAVTEYGALASTLGAATLNASGTVSAAGTLTATLGPAVLSASGFVLTNGMLTGTLAPLTLAGAGFGDSGSGITGQLAGQLQPLALAAAGDVTIQGQASIVLDMLSASSAGFVSNMGQAAAALGALSVSAYGGVPVAGVLQATLGELTLAATAGMFVFTRSHARTYVIQPENRRYTIAAENRTYRIEP